MRESLVRNRILEGRQWDIYSRSDYSGRGNGGLRWQVGNRDYRAMYDAELKNLDTRYGGFTDQSYSADFRNPLSYKGGGLRAMMGKKGQFEDGGVLSRILGEGDISFAKNQKLREFLKVMPDIGKMDEAEQAKWFTKMTGRTPNSDKFSKANFDNFRNMNVADYVDVQQVGLPCKYETATEFGTAEAYNQLLPGSRPDEKIVIAVEKLQKYFEDMTVDQTDVLEELSKMAKNANKFYGKADTTNYFDNVQIIADNTGDL